MDAQQFSKKSGNDLQKVMIMAGGTGGHVMPALAVAQYLQTEGVQIHWLGTRVGIEARVVSQANIPISYIDIQGLRRTNWRSWLAAPWRIAKALIQSFSILQREQPDVVLSMGGYVSGPGALMAWLLRKPVILHEQNAVLGWTNRFLAKFAKRIMVAFPCVFTQQVLTKKIIHAGNPVREDILRILPPEERVSVHASRKVRLLVLGGSQGARTLNEMIPQALALLPECKIPEIWHQAGKNNVVTTEMHYLSAKISARISDFISDMAKAYSWADIVICRSGALTIAELSVVGVASILIPYPYAVDDHQTMNAKYLSDHGGAYLLPQSALTAQALSKLLLELIEDPAKRMAVAKISRQLSQPRATAIVAQQCIEVGCEK